MKNKKLEDHLNNFKIKKELEEQKILKNCFKKFKDESFLEVLKDKEIKEQKEIREIKQQFKRKKEIKI